ncbi:hypothetical protein ACHAWO_006222, partial [Cyclotella atomus]
SPIAVTAADDKVASNKQAGNKEDTNGAEVTNGTAVAADNTDGNAVTTNNADAPGMKIATEQQQQQQEQEQRLDEDSDEESYETESSDEEEEEPKRRGWFAFLKRANDDDDDSCETESDDDHSVEEPEVTTTEKDDEADEAAPVDQLVHPPSSQPVAEGEEADEEEITQAIQRVQRRIADYRKKQAATTAPYADVVSANINGDVNEVEYNVAKEAETVKEAAVDEIFNVPLDQDVLTAEHDLVSCEASDEAIKVHEGTATIDAAADDNELEPTDPAATQEQGASFTSNPAEVEQQEDTEEEEIPSLSERHSLLSLAAQHNRVDVIQELIGMGEANDRFALLKGLGAHVAVSAIDDDDDHVNLELFVPPPLHAAVAHGSVDAVACLLRMGADPSLRPFPFEYSSSGVAKDGGDGNCKKYYGRTAWELAFGTSLLPVDTDNDENGSSSGSGSGSNRGWFGFTKQQDTKLQRQLSGLNIPQAKLDGIHHAFTTEALRAIGSDEVERLRQLLEAGMGRDVEVAGKTLRKWAGEMDAVACFALMMRAYDGDNDYEEQQEGDIDVNQVVDAIVRAYDTAADENVAIAEGELAGLSNDDIITLIQENESLIPALTACRDDLAEETDMCQNILRDIRSTGGKGGLASQSLLELVRSLKEDRQELEEVVKRWQDAWEEREDELDWFWEEAISDELRGELTQSGVLDSVVEPSRAGMKPISSKNATLQELSVRYREAMNRVENLRSSIASLAEGSATYRAEIENNGLSGALSLVQSLRGEVKELREKISQAQAGESICRRKIELIQRRIGHPVNEEEGLDDFQLNAIAGGNESGEGCTSPVKVPEPMQADVHSARIPTPEIFSSQHDEEKKKGNDDTYGDEDDNSNTYEEEACNREGSVDDDESSYDGDYEDLESAVDEIMYSETPVTSEEETNMEALAIPSTDSDELLQHDHQGKQSMKQSQLRESGMSTAIVLRQPNGNGTSLPSQIWDLLRRIIGLRRTSSAVSNYRDYEVNSTRHIMIV